LTSDNEFEKSLTVKGLSHKYHDQAVKLRKKLRKQLKTDDKKYADSLEDEIHQMELHDQLVSMAIFPFLQNTSISSQLGHQFIRSAPLLEKEVKNLDFLIYRKGGNVPIAIFGEAKTKIQNPTQIINEFKERKKVIESNKQYILEKYLDNPNKVIFEYVLCVFSSDAAKMKEVIEQSGGNIILWSADLAFSDLQLEGSKKSKTRRNMSHADTELSRSLNKVSTSKKASIMFQQSHIVTKLKSLITVKEFVNAIKHVKMQKFSQTDLDYYLSRVLFYLDGTTRNEIRDYIIKKAQELEFLKSESGEYKIITAQKNNRGQEKELERRWIHQKVETRHKQRMEEEVAKLRDEYQELNQKQPSMDKFFN